MKKISEEQLRILEKQEIECKDIPHMMCDYADGEITESLKARLDQHMEGCDSCREFCSTYLKTVELARLLKPRPLSVDGQNRLRKALNERLGISLKMVEA